MPTLPEWMTSWYFIITMAILLVALIGVLIFLRTQRDDDDD
ncbi:MAG: hypothetical protein ACFCD0_18240 [Gemmataceae bacterium]